MKKILLSLFIIGLVSCNSNSGEEILIKSKGIEKERKKSFNQYYYKIDTRDMICSGSTVGYTPNGWIDNLCEYGEGILLKSVPPYGDMGFVALSSDNGVRTKIIDGELWFYIKTINTPAVIIIKSNAWKEEFDSAIESMPISGIIKPL